MEYIPSVERVLFATRDIGPLAPDVSQDLERYRKWQSDRQKALLSASRTGRASPVADADVVVVVNQPDPELFERCVRSLGAQRMLPRTLSLVVVGPVDTAVGAILSNATRTSGVHRIDLPAATSIPDAVRAGVAAGSSTAWIHLGAHDQLTVDAVELLSAALQSGGAPEPGAPPSDGCPPAGPGPGAADVAYADEDRTTATGMLQDPVLKPDWSPELLVSIPYLGRPVLWRRSTVDAAGGIRALPDGDWEHDLMLRVAEKTDRVAHVSEVLCHRPTGEPSIWTPVASVATPDDPASVPGGRAVVEALARRHERGDVSPGPLRGSWRVRRHVNDASVDIVIPFRDAPAYLRACTDSLDATTRGVEPHLLLVDNGSVEPETHTLLDRLGRRPDVTIVHDPRPFNWSSLNNTAAARGRGDILVFMNNDIVALRPGWLEAMVAHATRAGVGAVGARLVYPTGRVQHAGVILGMGGAAGHVLAGLDGDRPGYLGMAVLTRDCSAVTGACLATARSVFEELGGFDESLGEELNDIDYCLRAAQTGRRTIYEPMAELVHHESPTRGTSGNAKEISRFIDRWEDVILAGDHHLNCHLTRIYSSCALGVSDEVGWWKNWRTNLGS